MEVCDVCGAFLIVGDAQQRIDDHLMGKQHVGYARLKSALQEIMVAIYFDIFSTLRFLFTNHCYLGMWRQKQENIIKILTSYI